jgi:hypothetical protein
MLGSLHHTLSWVGVRCIHNDGNTIGTFGSALRALLLFSFWSSSRRLCPSLLAPSSTGAAWRYTCVDAQRIQYLSESDSELELQDVMPEAWTITKVAES